MVTSMHQAKSLAQEVWSKKPSYPEVWNLLAKIHEEEGNLEEALTAFMTFVTLRYPLKTIESEITFDDKQRDDSNDPLSDGSYSEGTDSDFTDDDDEEENGQKSKRPTAQLIQKIASLSMKTGKYDVALEMMAKMEGYYRPMLLRLNDPKNRNRISTRWTAEELEMKKKEIESFLQNLYFQKVKIYKLQSKWHLLRTEYQNRYKSKYRYTHPLIVPLNALNPQQNVVDIEIDDDHNELLVILKALCPHQSSFSSYRKLWRYLIIFIKDNKFNVDSTRSLQWLSHQMSTNQNYKNTFKRLLTMLIAAAMDRQEFQAALKFLDLFKNRSLKDSLSMTFEMTIRGGICSLWIGDDIAAMKQYHCLVDQPQQTGLGSLYMMFADALIATNRLREAQVLMQRIECIPHFNHPRIWMRFGDYYALKKRYDDAITRYNQVINAVTKEIEDEQKDKESTTENGGNEMIQREDILLSARLKLLEIYFIRHDDDNIHRMLESIRKCKVNEEEQMEDDEEEGDIDGVDDEGDGARDEEMERGSGLIEDLFFLSKLRRINKSFYASFDEEFPFI